jgi:hypothetical protein
MIKKYVFIKIKNINKLIIVLWVVLNVLLLVKDNNKNKYIM